MSDDKLIKALSEGKVWRATWNEVDLDIIDVNYPPESLLFMTLEEAIILAEDLIGSLRFSEAERLVFIGFRNIICNI